MSTTTDQPVRAHHPRYGWGTVEHADPTELYQTSEPPVLFFIRWDSTKGHGVAGGWYSGEGEAWTFQNVVKLAEWVRAALKLREEAAERARKLGVTP